MERLTLRDDDGRALLTPYGLRIYCSAQATADCICKLEEALKAQEPRLMTLDELSEKTDVYFESLVYDTICPALSAGSYDDGTVGLMTLEDELFYMDEADYGVRWRCWTSRPTEEQREAEPWQPRG